MFEESLSVKVRGLTPTIMHNGRLADPMDDIVQQIRAITDKKGNKTDDDRLQLQRLEWFGGLYIDEQRRPCWPGENIEALIRTAAKKTKKGILVQIGVQVPDNVPVIYEGPKDLDKLYEDSRFRLVKRAVVGRSSIVRTRPIFPVPWSLEFVVRYTKQKVNRPNLITWIELAFSEIGLSDWRPKYGLAEVTDIQ